MEFRPINIEGIEGMYLISDTGLVFSNRRNKLIGQYKNNGYLMVHLVNREISFKKVCYIHCLVATAFIGERPKDKYNQYDVNHIDMDKGNNNVSNLEYITHQQNIIKARNTLDVWYSGRKAGFITSETTKQKMAQKKYKKCYIINESQRIDFNSVEECLKYLHTSRMQFSRYVNSCKTLNGFSVRMLS
jgi:hypothetical protein